MDKLELIQEQMAQDNKYIFTGLSLALVLLIWLNLASTQSFIIGISASVVFFLVNGSFLGCTFFKEERSVLRLFLGSLLLIAFLGLISWLVMIIYNLNTISSTAALALVSVLSTSLNRLLKGYTHTEHDCAQQEPANIPLKLTRIVEIVYLVLIAISFYVLALSRSGEIYVVWQYMHPMFIPLFFIATLFLIATIFSSERTEYKIALVVIHSILIHSFFFIIFPAGDIGGQQVMLGRTRLVFDNVILNGWPLATPATLLERVYSLFRPTNFQMALSVILARMVAVDVLWVHLFLVPMLWGFFVPIAIFMITKSFIGNKNENMSVLAGLLISLFPWSIYWGSISVPTSLGYIFFSYSIIFFVKYLFSKDTKTILLLIVFSIASFLGHFLTGIISFAMLLLAFTFRRYWINRTSSPKAAKASIVLSFSFCTSLLPMSLIYLKFFYPFYTYFSLSAFSEFSIPEIIWALVFGEYPELDLSTSIIHVLAPLLGIAAVIYVMFRYRKQFSENQHRIILLFMFTGFLMIAIDYRILKFFMIGLPFAEGRLWMFLYLIAIPFIAIAVYDFVTFLHLKASGTISTLHKSAKAIRTSLNIKAIKVTIIAGALIVAYISAMAFFSGWITLAVYRAYPHFSPLQITSYELESVKYIDSHTAEKYLVIGDMWILYAGHMIVGINNPRAFYFSSTDPDGVALFIQMKNDPTNETLIEAAETNNATVAYFIIEKPRLGTNTYDRIVNQAQQNGLQTYRIFYYPEGQEKLRIFYCRVF